MPFDLAEAYALVQARIAVACQRVGRHTDEITVVGVTKGHPAEILSKARALGLTDLGENRVQEAIDKYGHRERYSIALATRLHLIGHLQSNKVKKAVELFDCLDTVDSERIASLIEVTAKQQGKRPRVLMQVNTSDEIQKSGIAPEFALELAKVLVNLKNIDFQGLMTIGPLEGDNQAVQRSFMDLRKLRDKIEDEISGLRLPVLSMGMSGDFERAIEEGATEIRLGTILWGPRGQ